MKKAQVNRCCGRPSELVCLESFPHLLIWALLEALCFDVNLTNRSFVSNHSLGGTNGLPGDETALEQDFQSVNIWPVTWGTSISPGSLGDLCFKGYWGSAAHLEFTRAWRTSLLLSVFPYLMLFPGGGKRKRCLLLNGILFIFSSG